MQGASLQVRASSALVIYLRARFSPATPDGTLSEIILFQAGLINKQTKKQTKNSARLFCFAYGSACTTLGSRLDRSLDLDSRNLEKIELYISKEVESRPLH